MYQEALSENRDSAEVNLQMSLARTLVSPPQLDEALQHADYAIHINPTMGRAWKQKGDIYLRMSKYRLAEEAFVQAANMLKDWEKTQAQQALADVRSRSAAAPPATVVTPDTSLSQSSATVQLPMRQQGQTLTTTGTDASSPDYSFAMPASFRLRSCTYVTLV